MKKNKVISMTAGLAVGWACVFSCFSEPTPVHADFGEFVGAADYITSLSGEDAVALGSDGGAVAGLYLAVYMLANPTIGNNSSFDVGSISYMSGYYLDADGEIRIGVLTSAPSQEYRADGGFSVMYGYGVDLRCVYWDSTVVTSISNDNDRMRFTISGGFSRLSNVADSSGLLYNAVGNSNSKTLYGDPNANPPSLQNQLASFIGSNIISLTSSGALPSGTLDCADPSVYIDNVLRPYVEINYPDYIYLLPEPEPQPTETLDPSETMPGLPVIELPTVPAPDYDLELPEKMIEGAGFWFTALTEVLEEMGWLAVVIVLAVIAIVLYYVF